MCLGVPGKIIEKTDNDTTMIMGRVSFGGIVREICLAYVPEAAIGDYVIVHAGFAISKIDEREAQQVFAYLEEIGELEELRLTPEQEAELRLTEEQEAAAAATPARTA